MLDRENGEAREEQLTNLERALLRSPTSSFTTTYVTDNSC